MIGKNLKSPIFDRISLKNGFRKIEREKIRILINLRKIDKNISWRENGENLLRNLL